jgi:pyruvate-ferredoxin/flavodoxin oxidoreductase
MVKREPESSSASSDIHRFWAQTGNMYAQGAGESVPADPFMSMSLMPAVSSHFRDMTSIRFEHPEFIAENCTGCGDCYTVCPDTAIPGLVNETGQVLDTVVKRLKKQGVRGCRGNRFGGGDDRGSDRGHDYRGRPAR